MIHVASITVQEGMPGLSAPYVCSIRFVDPEQGTHMSEYGLNLFNYDKISAFKTHSIEHLVERAGEVITEVLCGEAGL